MALHTGISRRRRARLDIEGLESRRLMAFGVTQFPIAASTYSPQGLVTGADGNLWFSENSANAIGRFNPATHVETDYPLPTGYTMPSSVAAGPDGSIWFVDQAAVVATIGSINPNTGVITQHPVPNFDITYFGGMAFDGNGNIWLTDTYGNRVAKYDPTASTFNEYTVPTGDSDPAGITQGPDGSVWFTESNSDKIAAININTDSITEYAITGIAPSSITLGPDGNLWYTLQQVAVTGFPPGVGMFDPTTIVSSAYPMPQYLNVISIASGPGDALSFGALMPVNGAPRIGIIDATTKAVTDVPLGSSSGYATSVAPGPDGNTWFLTNGTQQSIGFVHPVQATQVTLTSSQNPSTAGQPVTFTATVAPLTDGGVPTGPLTFLDGSTVLDPTSLDSSGVATFETSTLALGSHAITADYFGDASFGQSVSPVVTQVVTTTTTKTTLSVSPNPISYGGTVTATALVTDAAGNLVPSGQVSFALQNDPGRRFTGSVINGTASALIPGLPGGSTPIIATYLGEGNYIGSTSNIVSVSVTSIATSLGLTSSANPQGFGGPVIFSAALAPNAGTYSGLLTFYDAGTPIGTVALQSSSHTASIIVSNLSVGVHRITAAYGGDSSHMPSTSATLSQSIVGITTTTATVFPAPNPVPFNSAYALTINVANATAGAAIPTGSVFLIETTSIGQVLDLGRYLLNAAGQVVVTVPGSLYLQGLVTVTASYSGDINHAPVVSAPALLNFLPPDGPQVHLITTGGNHTSTKTLVVFFNEPLYLPTSDNVNNYQISSSNGRAHVVVTRSVFNPLNNSVTLSLRSAVPLNGGFYLRIVGTGVKAITNANGMALDGDFRGIPGANFVTPLTLKNVFVKASPPSPTKKISHSPKHKS